MKKLYLTVLLIVALIVSVSAFLIGLRIGKGNNKLGAMLDIIEEYFALEYDEENIEDMAAKFMVYALEDPYSEYMTAEESAVFFETLEGEYKGIGTVIELDSEKDIISFREVEEGGPADTAGIKPGDILLSVDNIQANSENYDRIFYYIKGISDEAPEDDEAMMFKVLRGETELELSLKRKMLEYENVEHELIDGILYIKLREFSGNAPEKMEEALLIQEDFQGIILDLRDNGGGNLDTLMEIAEMILPEGLLLTTENADGKRIEYTVNDNDYCDLPLVVLVNGNTASASEVLTAAIKEGERGTVVGSTTFGKGLVQAIIPFFDGSTLRLTVEKYYTSGGNYINEEGIKPDIEIEDEEKQLETAFECVSDIINKKLSGNSAQVQ